MSPGRRPRTASDKGRPGGGDPLKRLGRGHRREDRLGAVAEIRGTRTRAATAALRTVAETADEDPIVRAAAITALAEQGRTIELEQRPPPAVRSAARKAGDILASQRTLEAVDRGELDVLPATGLRLPLGGDDRPIEPVRLPAGEVRRVAASSSLPETEIGEVTGLRCQDREYAIILRTGLPPAVLLRRTTRPAEIAVHHTDEVDVWTVPYKVLTAPVSPDGVAITIVDERGIPRFSGSARVRGGEVQFDIGAVRRPGASAVLVRGRVTNGRLTIDEARAAMGAAAPRQPQNMEGGTLNGPGGQRRR